jgi:hypothetical protein
MRFLLSKLRSIAIAKYTEIAPKTHKGGPIAYYNVWKEAL